MNTDRELLKNLDKLHTTELGVERIKRNLSLNTMTLLSGVKPKSILPMPLLQEMGKIGM